MRARAGRHGARRWLWVAIIGAVLFGLGSPPAGAREDGAAALRILLSADQTPARLCPAERRRVSLKLRNVGTTPWDPARGDRVAYHWLRPDGAVVVRDGMRSPLPGVVQPGQAVEVFARLAAPEAPGRYRLQWALVREGVRWVETDEDGPAVEVRGEGTPLAWSRTGGETLPALGASALTTVALRLRNEGCAAWSPAQGDHLAYRWHDPEGRRVVLEGERTPLPAAAPGEEVSVEARLRGPPRPGSYRLEWRPVREDLGWFPAGDTLIAAEVGRSPQAWSLTGESVPSTMAAGESLALEVVLHHEGEGEWSTERGDALSYRWFDAEGSLHAEGPRARWTGPLLPGDEVSLPVTVLAPTTPGRYRLAWEPVREGVTWYGPSVGAGTEAWVEVGAPRLAWALVEAEAPGPRWVHRAGTLRVVLRNTGAEAWSPEAGDRLSYRWLDEAGHPALGGGQRTVLPHEVAPGETIALVARVRGPDRPGRFTLQLEMVREHVRWYGPPSAGRARFAVRVERWSSYWVGLLGAAGLLAAGVLRRGSPRGWHWSLWRAGLALWSGGAVAVLVHCFVDLSGAELYRDAGLVVLGPAALLVLLLLPLPPRAQAWLGPSAVLLLTLMALADLAYLHFFGSIVPLTAVLAVHHLVDAEATVVSLLRPSHGWLLALPGLALATAIAWPRRAPCPPPRPRWGPMAALALGAALLVLPLARTLREVSAQGLDQRVFSERDIVRRLGVAGAHLFQLWRELDAWRGPPALDEAQRQALRRELEAHRARRERSGSRAPGFGAARGHDVVLVQVEALQGWVIGARVGDQAITPFLNRAAAGGALYFDQVYDQTGQGRTSDAEYLVLGGGHPPARGALSFLYEDNAFYTLAHVLSDAGYQTLSAHPYKRGFWNRARLHPRYGFARSLFRRELGPGPTIGWGLTDEAFLARLWPEIVALPRPSFAFPITLSLHHPYEEFPAALKRLDLGGLEGSPVGNYLHAMHHFDGALAALHEALRRAGREERTLLVIFGDHVTGLGEPEEILALAGRPTWDPSVHVALQRVPVIAWVGGPRGEALAGRRSTVGGHIDIGPTVLHLLGLHDPRPAALGRTLLDPGPGQAALGSGSAVDDERMFVAHGRGIPADGGCFARGGGRSLPRADCESLRQQAARELSLARAVLTHNLHREP